MKRLAGALVVFVAWSFAMACLGWTIRDGRADADTWRKAAGEQSARADQAEDARTTDHANASTSAGIESARVERASERETTFDQLQQDITNYARNPATPDDPSHRGTDRGSASPEFMRIWRAANAGRLESAESGYRAGTDAAGGAAPAADVGR